jgi:peroxiredoxin
VELPFLPDGKMRNVAAFASEGPLVMYFFPGIEWWADAPQVADLDAVQASDFRDYDEEFAELGHRILGVAAQSVAELNEWAVRERLRHSLASDRHRRLANALALPTTRLGQGLVYERLTLVVRDGRIRRVFYPVTEPDHAAVQVLSWLYQTEPER